MVVAPLIAAMDQLTATPESILYVKSLDIDDRLIEANCCFVAVTLANFFAGPAGTVFRLSPEGSPVVIIGARSANREEPQDLIAWPLYGSNGGCWGSLNLQVDLLGIPAAVRSLDTGAPLRLHQTPEAWLQSGFDGCAIVNLRWGGHWLSKLRCPIVCDDLAHGREVAAMLRPYGKENLVSVPSTEFARAA